MVLSNKFPTVKFQFDYADEDSGSNTGRITIHHRDIVKIIQPESQSKEGYEIYFELNPDSINNYKLVNGKYKYAEDEE